MLCPSIRLIFLRFLRISLFASPTFNTFACHGEITCHMPTENYDTTSNLSPSSGNKYVCVCKFNSKTDELSFELKALRFV